MCQRQHSDGPQRVPCASITLTSPKCRQHLLVQAQARQTMQHGAVTMVQVLEVDVVAVTAAPQQ